MSNNADTSRRPEERVNDIPRILGALRQAVQEALLRHKLAGNPLAIWRDGKVVWIAPEDISVGELGAGQAGEDEQ
jgi:hypothetical protein